MTKSFFFAIAFQSFKSGLGYSKFIKSLDLTGKVHEVCIAFKTQFQYNKEEF